VCTALCVNLETNTVLQLCFIGKVTVKVSPGIPDRVAATTVDRFDLFESFGGGRPLDVFHVFEPFHVAFAIVLLLGLKKTTTVRE